MRKYEVASLDELCSDQTRCEEEYLKDLGQALIVELEPQKECPPGLPITTKENFVDFAYDRFPKYVAYLTWSRLKTHYLEGQRFLRAGNLTEEQHTNQYAPIKFFLNPNKDQDSSEYYDEFVMDTGSLLATIQWCDNKSKSIGVTAIRRFGKRSTVFCSSYVDEKLLTMLCDPLSELQEHSNET